MVCHFCLSLMIPGIPRCAKCGRYTVTDAGGNLKGVRASDVVPLSDVEEAEIPRMRVGGTWDRAWGGGVVPGLVILLTGEPGAGKTTLAIQHAPKFIELTGKWAYLLSAEQSAGEIKAANKRLGLAHMDRLLVLKEFGAGGELDEDMLVKQPPAIIIVDSISAMCGKDKEAAVALAKVFKKIAVKHKCAVILIAHMNKQGDIGGFFTMQYDVDALASLEHAQNDDPRCYDRAATGREFRKLTVFKHRFGPTKHDHWFEMTESGLSDVPMDYQKKWNGEEGDEPEPVRPTPPPPAPRKPSVARLPKEAIVHDGQKLVLKPKKPARASAVEGEALKRPRRSERNP